MTIVIGSYAVMNEVHCRHHTTEGEPITVEDTEDLAWGYECITCQRLLSEVHASDHQELSDYNNKNHPVPEWARLGWL